MINLDIHEGVGRITLARAAARNALSREMISAIGKAVEDLESNADVRVILLTGGPPFCAGADIAEMKDMSLADALDEDFSGCCDRLGSCRKPVIAAIEGYALGGGCELIEMCDIVIAAEDAHFGHPEITLGTLSGGGGTQRLARAVGRAKAMDLILSGRFIDAQEAERIGLISRVVPAGQAVAEATVIAKAVASRPVMAARFAKEAVNVAVSVGLAEGLRLERRLFHQSFATGELHDGMRKFLSTRNNQ
ncbi:enoyl-CoA hydratase [Enhydrobacter aerosaccus]|uniref:Enoyl-CoA hydratase n=1 Tax=Enhydrobacter aerosaccus TaxID=225324 RepID=A0A1T4TJA3_9HYPH|nr:enoyl-CoA hydratase-related protein [Enhydrobacter aerosaccus]SKA40527.1 enoyl-CoA hydratase [Enhydrobacter aerosaccus]